MCSVCIELYNDPVLLDCGHNLCRGCACTWHDVAQSTAPLSEAQFDAPAPPSTESAQLMKAALTPPSLRCPICRAETLLPNGAEGLKCNITLRNVVESLREEKAQRQQLLCGNCEAADALFDCEDCNFQLCRDCKDTQHSRGGYKRHKIHPLGTLQRLKPKQCETHNKDLDLYCPLRNELLCVYCLQLGPNKGDNAEVVPLADAVSSAQTDVRLCLERLDARIADIVAVRDTPAPTDAPQDSIAALRTAVTERFASVVAAVQAKEALLIDHLDDMDARQTRAREEARRRSGSLLTHMRDVSKRFAEAVEVSHHADFVRAKAMILERVSRLADTELPESPSLTAPALHYVAPLEAALLGIKDVAVAPPPPPPKLASGMCVKVFFYGMVSS